MAEITPIIAKLSAKFEDMAFLERDIPDIILQLASIHGKVFGAIEGEDAAADKAFVAGWVLRGMVEREEVTV